MPRIYIRATDAKASCLYMFTHTLINLCTCLYYIRHAVTKCHSSAIRRANKSLVVDNIAGLATEGEADEAIHQAFQHP